MQIEIGDFVRVNIPVDRNEKDLVVRLRNSAAFVPDLPLVAETGGEIVGYILFTRALIR